MEKKRTQPQIKKEHRKCWNTYDAKSCQITTVDIKTLIL